MFGNQSGFQMKKLLKYLLPILLGSLLLPVPLLRDFHFESALIAATYGCFWAGIRASKFKTSDYFEASADILLWLYLFGLPLFLFSLLSGCLTWDGVGFWIWVPVPSVYFGLSIGRFFKKMYAPLPTLLTVLMIIFVAGGVWLVEFFTLPQVYFYNHVWGIWPGPIYDESVHVTGSLFFFRFITFLWVLIFWWAPEWKRSVLAKAVLIISLIILVFSYSQLSRMGVITPRSYLKQEFALFKTDHFDLYYSEDAYSEDEVNYWAARHEFHFQQITQKLDIDWPEGRTIESYLYANAWQKKKLVGAKFTSYVPIWLDQDQLHIAKQQLNGVLKHELVHAISKQFGNWLYNGSKSIGLIEGVAEAIAADASPQSTLDQIIAAEPPYPTVDEMSSSLGVGGFYFSASAISYTTAGSFVSYLLNNYPPENFKCAYPSGDFDEAFGVPFDTLVTRWQATLPPIKIDSVDRQVSSFIFSQRSLFQRFCPHAVTPALELWDNYQLAQALENETDALAAISELHDLDPNNLLVKQEWIRSVLLEGNYESVIESFGDEDSLLIFGILKADALALSGDWSSATETLLSFKPEIDTIGERKFKYSYEMREDSLNWSSLLNARYHNKLPSPTTFSTLNTPVQMLIIAESLDMDNDSLFTEYSSIAIDQALTQDWFDIYESLTDRLSYLGEFELAEQWIRSIQQLELRARYQERLKEQIEWMNFQK